MTSLANRSIDLLTEYAAASRGTPHEFMMNRCGYIFLSAQSGQIERYKKQAEAAKDCGSGTCMGFSPSSGFLALV